MQQKSNLKQLVLRRDTATGLTLVGWDADLPVGRFQHLEIICESEQYVLPETDDALYDAYQSALHRAQQANYPVLQEQVKCNLSRGWNLVPFELARCQGQMGADRIGNYAAAAMQLHYILTKNQKQAWAVIHQGVVVHVRARYPRQSLDELTYQVWYHRQLHELEKVEGDIAEGQLLVCESGLWFKVK